ncbi:MAG: anthranilate phosphoribosyltransferase [Nitrososphaerota archaeon]|jgi:anthranilate phosphoribosyltransferase|nr:anthranilate phosphoribosyltransferase [Nitrososphaerota archaeon]
MIREGIQKLIKGTPLTYDELYAVMTEVMSGKVTNAQTAAFLTVLQIRGESVEALFAFASVIQKHCHQIHPKTQSRLIDTCGTGGAQLKTFNISTVAAFVIAGAGVPVAKHGNRAITSKSGSADVLEKLGLNFTLEPLIVEGLIEQIGIGFMFAPHFHPALKYAAETRCEIGIRTVFNLLGPLTNPAHVNAQLLGVYDPMLVTPLVNVLQKLGCDEAMVVHGLDGIDEISTIGKTVIAHLKEGTVVKTVFSPSDFGVKKAQIEELYCSSVEENAKTLFRILNGKVTDAKRDIVLVNSAAGILIGGKANSFKEAVELARYSIESGFAYGKLKELIRLSGGNLEPLELLEANL